MSDMKQLQEMLSQLTAAITQMAISQNRNLVVERAANDAREAQLAAQVEQRSVQLISAVATQCNKIEKFESGKVIKFLHSVKHAYDLFTAPTAQQQIINFAKLQLPASADITQKDFATFELFATAVRKCHRPAESVARMNQAIATVHQQNDESVTKYADRVRNLQEKFREIKVIDCEDRNHQWSDEKQEELERTVNDQFVLGLKEKLRPFVNAEYATIEQAVGAALKAESNAKLQKLLSTDDKKFDSSKQNEKKVDKTTKSFKRFEMNPNSKQVDENKSDGPSPTTEEPVVQCEKVHLKGHTGATCRRKPAIINQAVVDESSSEDDAEVYMLNSSGSKNGETGLWQTATALKRK